MRLSPIVPLCIISLACGSTQLSKEKAMTEIKKHYPVVVTVRVPDARSEIKGSPKHAELVLMQEQLTKNGWFEIARSTEGDRERFQFKLTPKAPSDIRASAKGWEVPAAKAEFEKVTGKENTAGGARVTYQIRLTSPTSHFSLFQALHPKAKIGTTNKREAIFKKDGRNWVFESSTESFKKAN